MNAKGSEEPEKPGVRPDVGFLASGGREPPLSCRSGASPSAAAVSAKAVGLNSRVAAETSLP